MNPLSFVGRLMPRDVQSMPLNDRLTAEKVVPAIDLEKAGSIQGAKPADGGSFDNVLGRLVNDVNAKQLESADAVQGLMSGGDVSLHQAMIAMEEASVSFQLMVEVRNKLLESYQEIMRMQL
jgi:flagellar hook-basal body complex protein FliE